MAEQKKTDWERIEEQYCAGVLSLREIASQHGISEGAIRKHAKRKGWSRDLNAKIQQKADDLVRKQEVRSKVRTDSVLTERVLIEANAEAISAIRMGHRSDIRRSRELVNTLLDELSAECGDVEALQQLGEIMRSEDDKGRDTLNDLYHKIISLPSRVKSMKDLTDALKTLIGLEREAYGIDKPDADKKPPMNEKSDEELTARIRELMHEESYAGAKV